MSSAKQKRGRNAKVKDEEPEEYVVEAIRGEREVNGRKEYLVKWENFSDSQNTWEPIDNLTKCTDILGRWEAEKVTAKKAAKNGTGSSSRSRSVSKSQPSVDRDATPKEKRKEEAERNKRTHSVVSDGEGPEEHSQEKIAKKLDAKKKNGTKADVVEVTRVESVEDSVGVGAGGSAELTNKACQQSPAVRKADQGNNSKMSTDPGEMSTESLQTPKLKKSTVKNPTKAIVIRGQNSIKSFKSKKPSASEQRKLTPVLASDRAQSRESSVSVEDATGTTTLHTSKMVTKSTVSKLKGALEKDKATEKQVTKSTEIQNSPKIPQTEASIVTTSDGVSGVSLEIASPGQSQAKLTVPKMVSQNQQNTKKVEGNHISNGLHEQSSAAAAGTKPPPDDSANGHLKDSACQTIESINDDPLTKPIPRELIPFKGEIERLRWMAPFATNIRGMIPVKDEPNENCLCLIAFKENGVEKSGIFMKRVTKFVLPLLLIRFYEQYLALPSSGDIPRPTPEQIRAFNSTA